MLGLLKKEKRQKKNEQAFPELPPDPKLVLRIFLQFS